MVHPSTPTTVHASRTLAVQPSSPLSTLPPSSAIQPPSSDDPFHSCEWVSSDSTSIDDDDSDYEDIDDLEFSRNQLPDELVGSKYLRHSERVCMRRIEAFLRKRRMSIGQFLSAWVRHGKSQRRIARLRAAMRLPLFRQIINFDGPELAQVIVPRVRKEWSAVLGKGIFCKELPSVEVEQLDPASALDILLANAPTWVTLLQSLLRPRRIRVEQEDIGATMSVARRILIMTAICFSTFARNAAGGFRLLLGCYLHEAGLTRRGNEVLAGFGLVPTFKYVNNGIARMAERGKVGCSNII